MKKHIPFLSKYFVLGLILILGIHKSLKAEQTVAQQTLSTIDKQYFIENKGQWPSDVLYLARMGGLDAWITKYGVNYTFFKLEEIENTYTDREMHLPKKFEHKNYDIIGHRVLMQLQNHNSEPLKEGKEKQAGYYNYFIGNDDSKHASNVGLFKEAIVKDVYQGIDLRYYYENGMLRYDYIVHPGANPAQIAFTLKGSEKTYVNDKGNLVFATRFGEVSIADLYVYQGQDNKSVPSSFLKKENNCWAFAIANYDRTQDLIIDPLIYSTYIGGSNGETNSGGIALDANGNSFITGATFSTDYDVSAGAFQTTLGGVPYYDVFVTKLNASGNALLYSTLIGGSNDDYGSSIAIDDSGNVYITGSTKSSDYDITAGAYQTTFEGNRDVILTKLNASGTALLYSTYIGGSNNDIGVDIAIDAIGNAYITGFTQSLDYDVTQGAFQTTNAGGNTYGEDVFVTKLNPTGTVLLYSTYIGGSSGDDKSYGIALDNSGNAYITGSTESNDYDVTPGAFQTTNGGGTDVFVTKLNSTGTALVYSTYLGGLSNEISNSIAIDTIGNAFITGFTFSTNYPVTPGAFMTILGVTNDLDIFVTKLNSSGTALVYSTYIGGTSYDYAYGLAIDTIGNAFITGFTFSTNYPVTPGGQTTYEGFGDVFVTKLNSSGTSLQYSTYIGGSSYDYARGITLDANGYAFITGYTESINYDVSPGAFQTNYAGNSDAFVSKFGIIYLSSAAGTDSQTVCINNAITNITYNTTGATGATVAGLPAGVTGNFAGGAVTISGTPTATGIFNYTITFTGIGTNATIIGTLIVNPNTINLSSNLGTDNQTLCINTSITNITYSASGATGVTIIGLPAGVTGNFAGGVVTISGTPTANGTFNYTISPTGGCGNTTVTGIITVNPASTLNLSSVFGSNNQFVCINTAITIITYNTTGVAGVILAGLPAGVTSSYSGGIVTISGSPTAIGIFNYTVSPSGGCGNATATGTITVNPDNTLNLSSASGTDNQTVFVNNVISNITYSTTGALGATVTGLPASVTGNFAGGVVTISGTPTITGTFNYIVSLTGGCGNTTAAGSINVNAAVGIEEPNYSNSWAVYPNPATNQITIQSKQGGVFEWLDVQGRILQTITLSEIEQRIQVDYPLGLYFIREQKSGSVKKILVE